MPVAACRTGYSRATGIGDRAAFPWDPRDSAFAQVGGLLLMTLGMGFPFALGGAVFLAVAREMFVRRIKAAWRQWSVRTGARRRAALGGLT